MGKHYIPQAYLCHFQISIHPGSIWLYDKTAARDPHMASINKVAQSKGYYSPETERWLAEQIERPANIAMDSLMQRESLAPMERSHLSLYLCIMMTRVPAERAKLKKMYPSVLNETIDDFRRVNIQLGRQLENLKQQWLQHPPQKFEDILKEPRALPKVTEAVYGMSWRVLQSSGPQSFITSDNPVIQLNGVGFAKAECEITFPLSPTMALHGCWQGKSQSLVYMAASQHIVKEINRRTISGTNRFVFCEEKELWLEKALVNPNLSLNPIVWQ